MLQVTLGWRRDFYEEQVKKHHQNQENGRNLAGEYWVEQLSHDSDLRPLPDTSSQFTRGSGLPVRPDDGPIVDTLRS
jgi:hypothetical protein